MKLWLLAGSLALLGTAAGAAPQTPVPVITPTATRAAIGPTEAEALAFVRAFSPSHLRRQAELNVLEKNFIPGLRQAPELAALLDAFPQLGPELKNAMASQVDLYITEYDERFFPRAAAIVRESLSAEDLKVLLAFYQSPTGLKMLAVATDNVDGTEIMERAAKDQAIDQGVATRQAMRAGILTYGKLSETERAQIRAIATSPAGLHFQKIMPKLTALQTELMNDPGPRFKANSDKAMGEAMKRVTGFDMKDN